MITKEDRIKYSYHTDESILGIKLIGGLRDLVLLKIVEKEVYFYDDKAYLSSILTLMGEGSNPNWITAQVAEELYNRDLIDEEKLNQLTD